MAKQSDSTRTRSTGSQSPRKSTRSSTTKSSRSGSTGGTQKASSTRNSTAKPKSTRSSSRKKTTRSNKAQEPRLPSRLQLFLEDPDALRNLGDYLPRWFDEVLAALLMGIGAVSLAALINSGAEGELSSRIETLLRQGFGDGAILAAAGILLAGILILLPKIGVRFNFTWGRLLALELTFLCFQGLLHLIPYHPEMKALAREGQGGGYLGWGVSSIVMSITGSTIATLLLGLGFVIGLHWLFQIRRSYYRQGAEWLLEQVGGQLPAMPSLPRLGRRARLPMALPLAEDALSTESPATPAAPATPSPAQPQHAAAAAPAPSAIRINTPRQRGNNATVAQMRPAPVAEAAPAPSASPAAELASPPPSPQSNGNGSSASTPNGSSASATPTPPEAEEISPGMEERPPLIVNGQVIEPEVLIRERPSIVPRNGDDSPRPAVIAMPSKRRKFSGGRDDDPNKRYFTVEDSQERTKIGKRNENLPPLELLHHHTTYKPTEEEINKNASLIENTLLEFDIDADVIDVRIGPVVTQYAVSPIKEVYDPETGQQEIRRVRVDRIVNLQSDLAMALSARTLRIEAPVPGHSYVGIEVPNRNASVVSLRSVLESESFYKQSNHPLSIPLGRDVSGDPLVFNLAAMPHLLIAGTTGSGKSVCLTSLIAALVMNNTPDRVRLIMLDPKRVELTRFNGLPHLMGPVETEAERIIGVLRWTTREMDRRYKLLELENARNIEAYNAALGRSRREEHLPYLVLVFDEIGDLMMSHPDETETTVTRLAQKARAAGIHLVIATQRPSTDILTGLIKANFPGRISFAVASGVDSRVILDYMGAETLLGKGDMLYLAADAAGPRRVQGCYVSDTEVEEIVLYWKGWYEEQIAEGSLEALETPPWERGMTRLQALSEEDPMLEEAIVLVCSAGEASTSLIQRRLGVGYPRAARLMDLLQELGVIGPPKSGGRAREVMVRNPKTAIQQIKRNR